MTLLHYKVIYRNGDRIPVEIADFYRTSEGNFVFEYVENPKYEFPGFDMSKRKYENDHLWEQITFRIPNNIRNQHPNVLPEELLKETEGKLVTDHFEFQIIN
jgi:hypothetical protein